MAAAKNKIYTAKISESNRKWLSIILVVAFISLLFQLKVVAKPIVDFVNKTWPKAGLTLEKFQKTSSHVFGVAFALTGVILGALLIPFIPFVALGLVIAGGIVLALKLWQIKTDLGSTPKRAEPTGDVEGLGSIGGVGPVSGQPRDNQPYVM